MGRRFARRVGACLLVAVFGFGALSSVGPSGTALAADNPIVTENLLPGSSGWQLGGLVASDATGQIKGYTSATSVSQGGDLSLYVSVNPVQTYSVDFFRVGWYGGLGARLRLHVGPLNGVRQSACVPNATTGLNACGWPASYTLTIPADWTSGVYLGLLTNSQGYQNYLLFVVRDGRPATFLYQQSATTDQAYNNYPNDSATGKSLYTYNSYGAATVAGDPRAVKVSFDRPYSGNGAGLFFAWELQFIRWIERSGYDVTYSTDVDTHANGAALRNSKAFLSVGHDEYWSTEMRDAAEAARDAGVHLAFFGGDDAAWQIRFESSAASVPNRVIVCYKDATIDPVQGPTTTVKFGDPFLNRPEQSLMGVMFASSRNWDATVDYVVTNSSHWVYAGTGFKDGDTVRGIVGYEMDRYWSEFPAPVATSRTLLGQSPYTTGNGLPDVANSSIYQAPSGAWVFAAGTISWSWGLDNFNGHAFADARIQQTTANILNAFQNAGIPQPPPALQITGVQATNLALTSATIGWQTNNTANSRVDYGTTTGYGSFATSATLVNTHSVALSGLAPRTIYHYQVTSVDAFAQSVTSADATFTTASSTFDLFVSAAANRSAPSALQGQTVAGTIYVFTSPASGVTRVRFWLDNPQMSGTPRQTEGAGPWDFAGTAANGTANPTNTKTIANGSHTITAAIDKSAGGTDVVTATFIVGN